MSTRELYPNGISTSLPFDVQVDFVRTIKGFERAEIIRPGYAIEYDYFDPTGLYHSLETKEVEGLFSRVKSMERPVMKRPLPKVSWQALMLLLRFKASLYGSRVASKPTWE